MTEKRKPSTRNRGEPPLKKRLPTPTPPPEPAEPVEEGLPVKLKDNQELPTLPVQQGKNLPTAEYQSIAESGVLAASIERSRQRWLTDGVFERYWAKPSKKRAPVGAQNPSKESMSKLGNCSIIIEPHVFETILFTVRERQSNVTPSTVQVPALPQPPPPDMRYSSFSHVAIYHPVPRGPSNPGLDAPNQRQEPSRTSQPTLPPFQEGFAQFAPQGPPSYQNPFAVPNAKLTASTSQETANKNHTTVEDISTPDAKPSPDPVIQMLATRAASNHDLKALMKVVASGNASQEQLVNFQNHIDELNGILKSRNESSETSKDQSGGPKPKPPHNEHAPPQQSVISTSTLGTVHVPKPTTSHASSTSIAEGIKQEPLPQYFSHYTQPPKPKSTTSHKLEISAIVFGLGGRGDRFLFPRFSILEYLPGGTQVIVSFLVIRKGSTVASKAYRDTLTYYQPVTMRLSASASRILEPLARIVAPPDEVRKYMNSIFDKMSPAENVFLATRLPRRGDKNITDNEDQHLPSDSNLVRAVYSPPNSLVPLGG